MIQKPERRLVIHAMFVEGEDDFLPCSSLVVHSPVLMALVYATSAAGAFVKLSGETFE